MYEAKVIADSICNGQRLTTMQLTHPLIIHAEFMTHGMFARNASSSRAIPFAKMLERVRTDPYIPRRFGKNQKGMQMGADLSGMDHDNSVRIWLAARDEQIEKAMRMADPNGLNVHKGISNRFLNQWMWITCCVSGTWDAWSNYFGLRCHEAADYALSDQAYPAQLAYFRSVPQEKHAGEWHLPYVSDEELPGLREWDIKERRFDYEEAIRVSAARCTRTSYLTQEGIRDPQEDLAMFDRIVRTRPLHASGLEHTALAMGSNQKFAKYTGWKSLRHYQRDEYNTNFVPNHPELVGLMESEGLVRVDTEHPHQYPWRLVG